LQLSCIVTVDKFENTGHCFTTAGNLIAIVNALLSGLLFCYW